MLRVQTIGIGPLTRILYCTTDRSLNGSSEMRGHHGRTRHKDFTSYDLNSLKRPGKCLETERRLVVLRTKDGRGEVAGSHCLMSTGLPSGGMKMFWN